MLTVVGKRMENNKETNGSPVCLEYNCSWWRHQRAIFSRNWHFVRGIHRVTGGFPSQRPVTRSFDVLFDLRLNKRLCKQWKRRWFEKTPCSLWCHCNVKCFYVIFVAWSAWCWLLINEDLRPKAISRRVHKLPLSRMSSEIILLKSMPYLPGDTELNERNLVQIVT